MSDIAFSSFARDYKIFTPATPPTALRGAVFHPRRASAINVTR